MEKFRSHSQSHNKPVTLLKANFYKPSYLLNQGTKEMDVIVQVKFFVVVVVVVVVCCCVFKPFKTVCDSFRGDMSCSEIIFYRKLYTIALYHTSAYVI